MRYRGLLVAVVVLAACHDQHEAVPGAPDPAATAADDGCADGFEPIDGDAGCAPVLPAASCGAGTRAAIGSAACAPVGVTSCAPGFVPDASGWGCDAVIAPTPCGRGTRERLGTTSCVPVSDCNAPFPPPGATHFVRASFGTGELDATHFRKVGDAVAAAPEGAVIAVDRGTYSETVVLEKRGVRVVGRCADEVVLEPPKGAIGSGFEIGAIDGIVLEKLGFRGFNGAVSVLGGKAVLDALVIEESLLAGVVVANPESDVRLVDVVVRGTHVRDEQSFGLFASFGANVTVTDSVFSGNEMINVGAAKSDTKVHLSRSIVRDGRPFGTSLALGMGVYASEGAAATIEESAVVDNSAAGVNVFSPRNTEGSATVRRSVVRGTKRDAGYGIGRGAEVTGGRLVLEQSTIGGSAEAELLVSAGASADIGDSTLIGAAPKAPKDRGALGLLTDGGTTKARSVAIVGARAGVEVQSAGKLEMADSLVSATRSAPEVYEDGHWVGLGIAVASKADLRLATSTIDEARAIGVLVTGKAAIEGTLVRGTRPSPDGVGGRGLSIQNGGAAEVARSAFVDNAETGVIVMLDGASLAMNASTVKGTAVDRDGNFGIGLLIGGDAKGTIESSTITESKGIGLAVAAAGAAIRRTTISRNAVGVHAQDGTGILEGDGDANARSLVISTDTRFVENATRLGSGVIALPAVLGSSLR